MNNDTVCVTIWGSLNSKCCPGNTGDSRFFLLMQKELQLSEI